MNTFSLLQRSLGQTISREELEQASVAVPSVARTDCAGIIRGLFGIVVSGLPHADALAFQRELAARDFPTDLVEDRALPRLHDPFGVQRIDLGKDAVTFTDALGRLQTRPVAELVFVAGGFVSDIKFLVERRPNPAVQHGRSVPMVPAFVRRSREEPVREFHLDLFFWSSPNRLRGLVSDRSTLFYQGRLLRLRDTALLLGAMMDLRELLPPERVGEGLKRSDTHDYYPSPSCYEEEIRWHFHRLIPSS